MRSWRAVLKRFFHQYLSKRPFFMLLFAELLRALLSAIRDETGSLNNRG